MYKHKLVIEWFPSLGDTKLRLKMIGFHSQDLNRILRVDIKIFVVVNINA
jgi:hypothetical protein